MVKKCQIKRKYIIYWQISGRINNIALFYEKPPTYVNLCKIQYFFHTHLD